MFTTHRMHMPPKRGRPMKPEGSGDETTKMVRLANDVAEMIGWIVKVDGGTAAQLLDPLIRAPIQARYRQIQPQVERIKQALAEAQNRKKDAK